MTDPRRPRPDQPDTASEVDPDVAQLADRVVDVREASAGSRFGA